MSDKKHQLGVPPKRHQEQEQPVQKKLFPRRLRDLCPELFAEPKSKKVENTSKSASTLKFVLKPIRLNINPADWEDSLPNHKPKSKPTRAGGVIQKDPVRKTLAGGVIGKNCVRKPLAGAVLQKDTLKQTLVKVTSKQGNFKNIFSPTIVKPKTTEKPSRTVRKNLFSDRQTTVSRSFIPQASVVKQEPQLLDNTQPLIDVNDAEAELFQKPRPFQLQNIVPTISISEPPTPSASGASHYFTENQICLNNLETSSSSPAENEFVENERKCGRTTCNDNTNLKTELVNMLRDGQDYIKHFDQKLKNLEDQVGGFREEFNNFCRNYTQNMNRVIKMLENEKENSAIDREWPLDAPKSLSSLSTVKKSVTFNFNSKSEDSMADRVSTDDKGLEKAVKLYNSMRKGHKSFLSTPKLDRTCLQTPKSLKKKRNDSISIKVQKQCLLLVDTPTVNKKM